MEREARDVIRHSFCQPERQSAAEGTRDEMDRPVGMGDKTRQKSETIKSRLGRVPIARKIRANDLR